MDGQKKLTRTNSSLLRSSPTIRSSIQSLSSVSEMDDIEEQKPHAKPLSKPSSAGSKSKISQTGSIKPVIAVLLLSAYTLFEFFNWDDIPTSENLLLALILVAALLFFVSRNKAVVESFYRSRFLRTGSRNQPVQWFIGEVEKEEKKTEGKKSKKIIREGVEFYSNGDFYEGEFHKGKCNGSGVYNYFVNGRYEDDWVDGKYDGYGIESWTKGSKYRGQYRQGLRHGYGVYKFYTGDSYAGEWCNGQSHGVGVQTCGDGSCFVGEFKYGVKHGLGCYHFRNGDRYAGEYFGDKIHGFGVYHFANGHRYEGAWHEGRKQGCGMYTFRNGMTRCGEWDDGNLKAALLPLSDSVVRAVQAARKRAENAIGLRPVEEHVNKAVMAVNRAATAARVAAIKAVQNRIDGKFCDTDS